MRIISQSALEIGAKNKVIFDLAKTAGLHLGKLDNSSGPGGLLGVDGIRIRLDQNDPDAIFYEDTLHKIFMYKDEMNWTIILESIVDSERLYSFVPKKLSSFLTSLYNDTEVNKSKTRFIEDDLTDEEFTNQLSADSGVPIKK